MPHGLRSTFRDWVADNRRADRDLAEAALSHVLDNETEAAYQRSDFLEQRRELMQAWADFATGKPAVKEPGADAKQKPEISPAAA